MRKKDLVEGAWVAFYIERRPSIAGSPIKMLKHGHVISVEGSQVTLNWYEMTWDYDQRPEGWSRTRWQMSNRKKPQRQTRTVTVPTRDIIEAIPTPPDFVLTS